MANVFQIMMPSIVKNHTEKRPKNLKTWKSVLVCVLCLILSFIVTFAIFVSKNKHNVIKTSYIRKHPKSLLNNQDVFISVKTTQKNHEKRLQIVLDTWYQMARDHTYFFTDGKGDNLDIENGHLVVTQCGNSHSRQDLCCKMSAEFDAFLESNKKWFCHFDDDNYVNVPRLVEKLSQFDHKQDWYLGKPSLPEPLEILDRDHHQKTSHVRFWFATGGAGFCLSQALAFKMMPLIGGGKFEDIGDKIRLPDDVSMGYVAEHLLKVPLTSIKDFHSHMEPHRAMPTYDTRLLSQAISYSYILKENYEMSNVLDLPNGLSITEDPTRLKSLHCLLYPQSVNWC